MPKLTLSLFEPIDIVIGEQKFTIDRISSKMLSNIQDAVGQFSDDPTKARAASFTDVMMAAIPGISREVAEELDLRHVMRIVEFLTEQINEVTKPGPAKN